MFQVALLQLLPGRTPADNLTKGLAACRQAKQQGADLALFPEMWNNGYTFPTTEQEHPGSDSAAEQEHPGSTPSAEQEWRDTAISTDSRFVKTYQALAQELDMAITITYLEAHEPRPRNTVSLIDRHGEIVLTYAKVHTCDFGDEIRLAAGDDFYVADLDTAAGPVKIGMMICYDREFPESARILMLKGAEIILVPNACPLEINRLTQLRARSFENMVGIATANYPLGKPDCNGHSVAFDGIAYGEVRPGITMSRDTLIVEAGEAEGIYLAAFPLDKLRAYRQTEVHGNAYRHPAKYHLLTKERIEEPFIRPDYRK